MTPWLDLEFVFSLWTCLVLTALCLTLVTTIQPKPDVCSWLDLPHHHDLA